MRVKISANTKKMPLEDPTRRIDAFVATIATIRRFFEKTFVTIRRQKKVFFGVKMDRIQNQTKTWK